MKTIFNAYSMIRKTLLAAAFIGGSSAALAASVSLPVGEIRFEDDNQEYLTDINGVQYDPTGADAGHTLAVGDQLHAVVTFTAIVGEDAGTVDDLRGISGTNIVEITGVSVIEVKSIDLATGNIVMGPSATFEATYGAGALVALFIQDPGDYVDSCDAADVTICEGLAGNGDPYMTVGFGDADDYWLATGFGGIPLAAVTIGDVAALSTGSTFGNANFSLSILQNFTGYDFAEQASPLSAFFATGGGDDLMTDIIGSGALQGGLGRTSPWFATSDFQFTLNRIPAPGSLGLLGLGLGLIGLWGRSRKEAAAG